MKTTPQQSLAELIAARLRDARGSRFAAFRELVADLWEFAKESMPERRRGRFGDVDYDFAERVNTTAGGVGWRERLYGAVAGTPYQPVDAELFRETLEQFSIRREQFTFIDLGSGKGRALLLAAEAGFRRVIGVELVPELHRIAEENVRKFSEERGKAFAIELHCGDARQFEFPAEPTVLFLFNPFPRATLARIGERFAVSLRASSREAWILYHNPVHLDVFGAEWQVVAKDERYAVLKHRVER